MTVKIVTDSGSDIAPELARQLGITIVPVYVRFGDKVYRDHVDIGSDEFFHKLVTSSVHPTTSAPSPGDFAEVYKKLAEETDEIVSIHITSKHSATYDAALQGKEALEKTKCQIEVIDSRGVTMAQGLVAMAAAKAAEIGMNLRQVVEKVHEVIPQIRTLGLLDTLTYVVKGGRLGRVVSSLGTVLNTKLLITLREGEIRPAGLVRTRAKGIDRLYQFAKSALSIQDLAIVHSTTPDEAQTLMERIKSFLPPIRPIIARVGPALGAHGGPGVLVVALREGKSERVPAAISEEPKKRFSLPSLPLTKQHFLYRLSQSICSPTKSSLFTNARVSLRGASAPKQTLRLPRFARNDR